MFKEGIYALAYRNPPYASVTHPLCLCVEVPIMILVLGIGILLVVLHKVIVSGPLRVRYVTVGSPCPDA